MDLTESFEDAARAGYVEQQVTSGLERMTGSGTVAVLAFTSEVGSSRCVPPKATVTWAGNTEKFEKAKKVASSQLLATLPDYFACAADSVKKKSSDILGAFAEAHSMLDGKAGQRTVALISDGCQNTYKIKTCKNEKMVDAKWRKAALAALPAALRPDFAGVDLIMQGVAVNSEMQQTGVDALKSLYREFAALTSAKSITIV
ncbi:MAG: hypothetical protein WBO89_12870 [Propionicimonas sp.]